MMDRCVVTMQAFSIDTIRYLASFERQHDTGRPLSNAFRSSIAHAVISAWSAVLSIKKEGHAVMRICAVSLTSMVRGGSL